MTTVCGSLERCSAHIVFVAMAFGVIRISRWKMKLFGDFAAVPIFKPLNSCLKSSRLLHYQIIACRSKVLSQIYTAASVTIAFVQGMVHVITVTLGIDRAGHITETSSTVK
ncbi:hypothetical protein BDZ85DRAFT_60926 [Elsinoe ampelina]|uniref:Uncharacterized protein n=1 Tax=Elsinoe ampelina TaxID=302913 RepID=A0A6A6G058_9PEZI|nr:hypothetical protein BDZ85DRAFT_60926 [Elsinoe ampelina]